MLGFYPKPQRGFHPHTPERGRPRGQKDTVSERTNIISTEKTSA